MPQIKQQVTQVVKVAQKSMEQVDMKSVSNKIQKSIQLIKSKIENLKKSNKNNEIAIKINNKDAEKQINQIEKEIDSLQKKISERELKLNITNGALDKIRDETRQSVIKDMPDAGAKRTNQHTELRLYQNNDYVTLEKQSDKLNAEIIRYTALLESAKSKMAELGQQTSKTATIQSKLSSFFSAFKGKVEQAKSTITGMKSAFSQIPKITKKITNNIKQMGTGTKQGLRHILRYAGALFSLRSIYTALSSSANSWLSSQNSGAQQLSANIEYMKYAMGSVFAPIIEYVTNLVYQLMKAIQSLAHAFSGINIFAKATASSMNKTVGSAKQANRSLSGVHSEIYNVSDKDNGGGNSSVNPNIDLSKVDNQISPLAQKLYDFFKPLKESWGKYGAKLIEQVKVTTSQVVELISSVWGSFENIITNGTVYSILENILAIIGNIANAFVNAWNYNSNGDTVIQNIADMLNNILNVIREIASSEGFQTFLNGVSNAFAGISEFLKPVLDDFLAIAKPIAEIALSTIGTVLQAVGDALKWIGENEIAVTIIESLAIAIGLVTIATKLFSAEKLKETGILIANAAAWIAANLPIILITAAITAVIAIIILCIKHWDEIKETVTRVCDQIKEKVSEWAEKIKQWFLNLIETVKTAWNNFWSNLSNKVSEIANEVKNTVLTWISTIKTTITNILNSIRTVWNNVWQGLGNTISNVWNGIWNTIQKVINWVLDGIEKFANGIVKGINKVLSGLNGVVNAVGKVIGIDIQVRPLNEISLPRLAKGNVAYSPMVAQFGEYVGASTNPEITTPQNIMRETFEDVLSNREWNSSRSNSPINLSLYVGNKKLGEILLEDLRDMKRQYGKNIEALVGG